jgi:hypothetical protein
MELGNNIFVYISVSYYIRVTYILIVGECILLLYVHYSFILYKKELCPFYMTQYIHTFFPDFDGVLYGG